MDKNLLERGGDLISNLIKKEEEYESISYENKPSEEKEECFKGLFVNKRFLKLPNALERRYSKLKYKCFMGLFPEIERAWVTFDNKFYIWNFLDGSDFSEYDELDQIIVCVGLANPKPDVFKPFVRNVLVLCTSIQVILVAVTKLNNEVNLLPTNYVVSSDNTLFKHFQSTKDGRIFLGGDNGHLYELNYSLDDGWFQKKCSLTNVTKSFFMSMITPSFLQSSPDPIIDISLDGSNNILYTLSGKGMISCYDLGVHGDELIKVDSISHHKEIIESKPWYKERIVRIKALENSKYVHLVCISESGNRFNWSVSSDIEKYRPHELSLLYEPIMFERDASLNEKSGIEKIKNVFYHKGVWIFSNDESFDEKLHFVVSENRTSMNLNRSSLIETKSRINIKGSALSIGEVVDSGIQELKRGNELQLQHRCKGRDFVCLTNRGIHLIGKKRPVDILQNILSKDDYQTQVKKFFMKYGPDEACAMCLILICQGVQCDSDDIPTRYGSSHNVMRIWDKGIKDRSRDTLFREGGEPTYEMKERQRFGGNPDLQYSSIHNGICLYLSRILHSLWKRHIMNFKREKDQVNIYGVLPKGVLIEETIEFLERLRKFFKENSALYRSKEGYEAFEENESEAQRRPNGPTKGDAFEHERLSLKSAYLLVVRSIECLYFLKILSGMDFLKLFNVEDSKKSDNYKKILKELVDMDFQHFVRSQGMLLMKNIVRLVIKRQMMNSLEDFFGSLKKFCPSIFSTSDIEQFRAFDLIERAKEEGLRNSPLSKKEELLAEALRAYIKISGFLVDSLKDTKESALQAPVLHRICQSFEKQGYFIGSVRLALSAAERVDIHHKAEEYEEFGGEGREQYEKRNACYLEVMRVLRGVDGAKSYNPNIEYEEEKKKILKIIRESRDRLFHEFIFKNYIQDGRSSDLLNHFPNSPSLEKFLYRQEKYDLLAQWYSQNGEHLEASDIFDKLASDPTSDTPLHIRFEYLIEALNNVKAAKAKESSVGQVNQMIKMLQSKINVCALQKDVLKEMQLRGRMTVANHLDKKLVSISYLYNNCASPLKMYGICLRILSLSNYRDKILVRELWENILNGITKKDSVEREIKSITNKLEVGKNEELFPIVYIISDLETKFYSPDDEEFVRRTLIQAGFGLYTLYEAYRKIYEGLFYPSNHHNIDDDLFDDIERLRSNDEMDWNIRIFHIVVSLCRDLKDKGHSLAIHDLSENVTFNLNKHKEQYKSKISEERNNPHPLIKEIDHILKEI